MCADNSARMIVRCDDLARRIAVFDRAFFHVSDQTASAIASLYLSANHRAVFDTFARISLMTDKCADFIPSLNLRIANHDVPNGRKMCIAKQPFRFFISGNFQAGNRVALSVKHTRKRQHVVQAEQTGQSASSWDSPTDRYRSPADRFCRSCCRPRSPRRRAV